MTICFNRRLRLDLRGFKDDDEGKYEGVEKQKNDGKSRQKMKAELGTCRGDKKGDHTDLNGPCFEELMENRTKKIKWDFINCLSNVLFLNGPELKMIFTVLKDLKIHVICKKDCMWHAKPNLVL